MTAPTQLQSTYPFDITAMHVEIQKWTFNTVSCTEYMYLDTDLIYIQLIHS